MINANPTREHAEPRSTGRPRCIGCHTWRSLSLLKTGCPSCMLVGVLLLPFSLIGAWGRRALGR